ncbi:hypothetical protein TNCV_2345821 [Trichonephila clavipes]|nr:hypothetical protein TNCV_2345821 [Trichonephila clavipes]
MWPLDAGGQPMDQRGRDRIHLRATLYEERQIVRIAVTDHSVTSRTVAQHIEPVMHHHSASTRTIRRRLQQSGLSVRRPLLDLPLTQKPQTSLPPMV